MRTKILDQIYCYQNCSCINCSFENDQFRKIPCPNCHKRTSRKRLSVNVGRGISEEDIFYAS